MGDHISGGIFPPENPAGKCGWKKGEGEQGTGGVQLPHTEEEAAGGEEGAGEIRYWGGGEVTEEEVGDTGFRFIYFPSNLEFSSIFKSL